MTFTPPAALGAFDFPAPYSTRGIRLTNASNAREGVQQRQYSYWSSINNHRGRSELLVFLGRIGQNPIILAVDKRSGAVRTLHELPWNSTGEGNYWSDSSPDWLYWLDSNRLNYFQAGGDRWGGYEVFSLLAKHGDDLWQAHSSADDQVHSATVRRRVSDGAFPKLGYVVFAHGQQHFFPAKGVVDECQVTKNGRWLVAQEDHNHRIFEIPSGTERIITNAGGALSHIDVGDDFLIGENDQGQHWTMDKIDLKTLHRTTLVTGPEAWDSGMGHVSVRGDLCLLSTSGTGEIWTVKGGHTRSIAPSMIAPVPADASEEEKYDAQLRANLDPVSEYACFTSNLGVRGGRVDAFLVKLPGGTPPIIIDPNPDPKPGGPTVGYPSEESWWPGFEQKVADLYEEAGKSFPDSPAAFRWHGRTAFDVGAGMSPEQSATKHLRELRAALGLTGGPTGNP